MAPTSSFSPPLSTLSQLQPSSSPAAPSELSCLQKAVSKQPLISPMSPFTSPYSCGHPFYDPGADGSEAGESIDQGFAGGDDPLLTSSWEALDKLVAASMTASASAFATEHMMEFASVNGTQSAMSDPSSLTEIDHKPLSALYDCLHQKGDAWASTYNNHARTNNPSANVGLNLASLISSDPGFVERAAKFSSYSQQGNNSTGFCSSHLQIKNSGYLMNPTAIAAYNVDAGVCDIRKLMNNNMEAAGQLNQIVSHNAAARQPHGSKHVHVNAPLRTHDTSANDADKRSFSPQASTLSLSGSKKKRDGSVKDEGEDANQVRKRAKAGSEQDDNKDASNNIEDTSPNHSKASDKSHKSKAACNNKTKQRSVGGSSSGESEQKSEVCNHSKTPSPSPSPSVKQDYIHVRARRGQATDSHSLAERLRREKISERMKYLQELVPGCTKVTGKAMMLDEIINYVQSLQRQVEFLSMKLAAVHPSKLEFNFESLFGKEMFQQPALQSNQCPSLLSTLFEGPSLLPLNSACFSQDRIQGLQNMSFGDRLNLNPGSSTMLHSSHVPDPSSRQSFAMPAAAGSSDDFQECVSQLCNAWVDDDLQNIVPSLQFMQQSFTSHSNTQGTLLNNQMKTEP